MSSVVRRLPLCLTCAFTACALFACTAGDIDGQGSTDAAPASGDGAVAGDAGAESDAGPTNSAGCTDGAGLAEGEHTVTLDGMDRRFIVHLPTDYTRERAWPLLFALHPNGSDIGYWDGTGGNGGDRDVRAEVGAEAILIVTEAIGGNWRDYGQPEDTWPARLEVELRYFDELFEQATTNLCVDTAEVFSMGFSGGGSFSGVLGCRRDYIRAFAGGGAVKYFADANCVQAPPAWITIGTLELSAGREEFRDFFRVGAGCEATSSAVDPAPCVAFDGCPADKPVTYCQHPGDHIWPNFGTAGSWLFLKQFID